MARLTQAPGLAAFGEFLEPEAAQEPILSPGVRGALLEWLVELMQAEGALRAVGIEPRRKALLDGPPGVGKTTMAHHLAARIGLPLFVVRSDRVLAGQTMGSDSMMVGTLFDALGAMDPVPIMFLDEFDSLGQKRRSAQQVADTERNRQVNTLLQRMERHRGIVMAATNHGADLDPAIWRRFDLHIGLDLPGQRERELILARYLAPFGQPGRGLRALAAILDGASPALIRALVENLKRQTVLGPLLKLDTGRAAVFERALASIQPHPDLGKPELWSRGAGHPALGALAWPLPLAADLPAEAGEVSAGAVAGGAVVQLRPAGGAG